MPPTPVDRTDLFFFSASSTSSSLCVERKEKLLVYMYVIHAIQLVFYADYICSTFSFLSVTHIAEKKVFTFFPPLRTWVTWFCPRILHIFSSSFFFSISIINYRWNESENITCALECKWLKSSRNFCVCLPISFFFFFFEIFGTFPNQEKNNIKVHLTSTIFRKRKSKVRISIEVRRVYWGERNFLSIIYDFPSH